MKKIFNSILKLVERVFFADRVWKNRVRAMQRELDTDRCGNVQITGKAVARDAECRAADRRARVILGGRYYQSVEVECDPIRAIYDDSIPVLGC